ncbi:MAG: hypothetical protein RR415_03570, partial [Ruthenibacterium sp.]
SYSRRTARLAATHNIKDDGGTVKTVPYGGIDESCAVCLRNGRVPVGCKTVPYGCIDESCVVRHGATRASLPTDTI